MVNKTNICNRFLQNERSFFLDHMHLFKLTFYQRKRAAFKEKHYLLRPYLNKL